MTQGFVEYCLKNQYSTNQTRSQAFTMGAASRQAEIDELKSSLDTEKSLRSMSEHLNNTKQSEIDELRYQRDVLSDKVSELQKRIDFLEQVVCENLDDRFLNVDFKKGEIND